MEGCWCQGTDVFIKMGAMAVCLCPHGVPLQRACHKQERRDNRSSDVLESVRGAGICCSGCVCYK